jgi:hypothetical protein
VITTVVSLISFFIIMFFRYVSCSFPWQRC